MTRVDLPPPETVAKEKRSYTGQFLKAVLAKKIAASGVDKGRKRGVEAAE